MRRLFIAILLCVIPLLSNGQATSNLQLDSLYTILNSEIDDSTTIRTLCNIGDAYFNINKDSSEYFIKKALALAKQKGSQASLAYANYELGYFYFMTNDYAPCMTYFDTAAPLYEKINDKKQMGQALSLYASCACNLGQYNKGLTVYNRILSFEDSDELKEVKLSVLVNMAYMYDDQDRKSKAQELYEKALRLTIKHKNTYGEMVICNNLSSIYRFNKTFKKAIQHSHRAIQIAKELDMPNQLILFQTNLGVSYTQYGVHDSAEYYLLFAYKEAQKIKELHHLSTITWHLAELYLKKKNIPLARKYGAEAMQLSKKINVVENIAEAFEILYDIEKQSNDLNQATQMADSLLSWRDSLYKINKQRKLTNVESGYNNNILIKENELKSSEIKRLNATKNLILIAVLLLLIILLALWMQHKRKRALQALNLELLYTERLTENIEAYRKNRANELHDDIGQDILLAQQSIQLHNTPLQTTEFIERALRKLRTISKNEFPYELSYVGLKKSLEYLVDLIEQNTALVISEDICTPPAQITVEQNLNIYRVVQELISNSIKNPTTSAVFIGMEIKENILEVVYKDNGEGFDFQEQLSAAKSIGLKIIVNRVRMLKGQLKTVPSVVDNRYVIHVPL